MGRRELRAEMQSTWSTYTPRVPGTPFREKDIEDAAERERAHETFIRWSQARAIIGADVADADEQSALGEPSHPGTPSPQASRSAVRPDGTSHSDAFTRGVLARFAK
jgi:hypothetical protein